MLTIRFLSVVILSFLVPTSSFAADSISLDAHQHGSSEMTIAIDHHNLEIEFISPAMNLVGFEYRAKTQADIARVKALKLRLSQYDEMFLMVGGNCKLHKQSIDVSSLTMSHHHAKAHDHQHQHEKSQSEQVNHSEVLANYSYHCDNTAQLKTINVQVFALFPSIHKMQAMWVTPSQQGALTLSPKNTKIRLR